MIRIREAMPDDAASINAISRGLGYTAVCDEVARNRLEVLLNSELDFVRVLEKQGQVVGWLHALLANRLASEAFIEIVGLAVSPAFRQQGVGSNLIEHVKGWAQARDLKLRVRCNSKREDSHKFYRAVGFVKIKSQNVFELC